MVSGSQEMASGYRGSAWLGVVSQASHREELGRDASITASLQALPSSPKMVCKGVHPTAAPLCYRLVPRPLQLLYQAGEGPRTQSRMGAMSSSMR